MAFSVVSWGLFSIVFIIIIGFISNTNPTSISNVQQNFNRLSCPMPAPSGLWNNSGTIVYQNGTYNIQDKSHTVLTLSCTGVHTIYGGFDYFYGSGAGVPFAGMPFFIGDYLGELADKVGAFFTILFLYVTPINFSILGYTLAQLTPLAQVAILGMYGFSYMGIGIMVYKVLSPFSGAD